MDQKYYLKLFNLTNKKKTLKIIFKVFLVRAGRLELPHLAALDPKSSVSTNSTTPAKILPIWIANIHLFLLEQNFEQKFFLSFFTL